MWTSNHKILLNQIIHPRDRVALVGRNGSGKSTLLKILHGLVAQDEGERMLSKGLSIGYMEQDPNLSEFSTLYDYVYSGVSENDLHLVEMTSQNLGVDLEAFNKSWPLSGTYKVSPALSTGIFAEFGDLIKASKSNTLDCSLQQE